MPTRLLRTVCRALIGVVLLAQLAVSAYACPGLAASADAASAASTASAAAAASAAASMPDCEGMSASMDPAFAALCAEHCRHGEQSDLSATLNVPAPCWVALYVTALAADPGAASRPAATPAKGALAAAFPPHAVLHCCFRI